MVSSSEIKDAQAANNWENHSKPSTIGPFMVVCISGLVTGSVATARGRDLLGLFIVLLGFATLIILLSQHKDARLRNLIILAFLLRTGLAITHAYIMPLPDSGADALTFERLGWQTAEAWLDGEIAPSLSGAYLYSLLIGVLYYLFGRIPLVAQFTNVLLGTFTVYFTWKLALLISKGRSPALIATLIAALFPTLNLYSAITMRESAIVFFTALSIYCFFLWLQRGRLSRMFGAVILLLPASILHSGMVFIEIVYLFFFCFYRPKKKKWVAFGINTIIALFLLLFVVIVFGDWLTSKLPQDIRLLLSPDYLGQRITIAARDRAAYLSGFVPRSIGDMLLQTPLRILYFLYTPFIWMVSTPTDIVGFFDALLYIFLSIFALKGLVYLWHKDKLLFWGIVLISVVFLVVFAWGTSNYGTAIRHRQKMVWFLAIPAAIGLARGPGWKWSYPVKKTSTDKDSDKEVAGPLNL